MSEVKAFVGHSFTDEDKNVVAQFIEFFNTLAKLNTSFSWVSARAAEPKQLAEKVLTLVQDRNLFIAICTKKERVINGDRTTRLFNRIFSKPDDLQWKTSDWVIQEIGLAIGRNMHLLLLVEEDVRRPGGLQGDVEYITFTRLAPERSFNRIAEMVTALGLNPMTSVSNLVTTTTAPPAPVQAETSSEVIIEPEASWTEDDYDLAQFRCIFSDSASAESIREAYLKLPGEPTGIRQSIWQARNESFRLLFGKGGDLDKLRELADSHPTNGIIKSLYARSLEQFDKYEMAGELFEQAATLIGGGKDSAECLARAVLAYDQTGASKKISTILGELRAKGESKNLYATLQELAERKKDNYLSIAALEGQIDKSPAAFRTRFALAYLHSQVGNEDLALHHYLQIPPTERIAMDWNNLGATYNHFRTTGRAVAAYRKSESMGETLAMSNLGFMLLQAGFVDEAQSVCAKALETKHFHKNIGQLSATIQDNAETETEAVTKVLEEAKPRVNFYNLFGIALGLAELAQVAKTWTGPDCEMNLDIDEDQVRFYGSFQRDPNALASALGLISTRVPVRHEVEYKGILRGRTVTGTANRRSDEKPVGLLGGIGDPRQFLMVISENEILILDPTSIAAMPVSFKRRETALQLAAQ